MKELWSSVLWGLLTTHMPFQIGLKGLTIYDTLIKVNYVTSNHISLGKRKLFILFSKYIQLNGFALYQMTNNLLCMLSTILGLECSHVNRSNLSSYNRFLQ